MKIARSLQSLHNVCDELTITPTDDLILRGNCIVIPKSLSERVINIAHEGHQGVVKTEQLLREKVWFAGIDQIVEKKFSSAYHCQAATTGPSPNSPLEMSSLPIGPWKEVSIDFADLLSGVHLLVVIDDYSRYPVVEVVTSTSLKATIPQLDKVFTLFGIPEIVRTDNGPPFNNEEFKQFVKRKTHACGTVRMNRKEMPKDLKPDKKMKRGDSIFKRAKETLAMIWHDKRDVTMLSTIHTNTFSDTQKKDHTTGENIRKPDIVLDYNKYMGGVDLSDFLTNKYADMRKSLKWYKKLFFSFE